MSYTNASSLLHARSLIILGRRRGLLPLFDPLSLSPWKISSTCQRGRGGKGGRGSPSKTDWPRPQIDGSSSDRDSHGQAEIVRRPRKTSRTISHTFWFIGGKYPREKLSDWAPGNDGIRSVGHHPQILPIFHIKRSGKREGEPSPLALSIRSPSSFFGGALSRPSYPPLPPSLPFACK